MHTNLPTDVNLYAPGLAGTVRWMGYWLQSRSANAFRDLRLHWRLRTLPALASGASRLHANVLLGRARRTDDLPDFAAAYEASHPCGTEVGT